MYCRQCGKKIPDDSKFCQYCGVAVVTMDENEENTQYIICLTEAEVATGVKKAISIDGDSKSLEICIPPKVKDGQVLILKKVKVTDSSGKTTKKDICLRIQIEK